MEMLQPQSKINGVYYVDSKERVLNPIAIRPTLFKDGIIWEDTSRGFTAIPASVTMEPKDEKDPKRIIVKTQDNNEIILTKLNLDTYNQYVKKRVAGRPDFNSDQELVDYYLNTDFQTY